MKCKSRRIFPPKRSIDFEHEKGKKFNGCFMIIIIYFFSSISTKTKQRIIKLISKKFASFHKLSKVSLGESRENFYRRMTATTISPSVTRLWWEFDVLQEIKEEGGGGKWLRWKGKKNDTNFLWFAIREHFRLEVSPSTSFFSHKLQRGTVWMKPLTTHNYICQNCLHPITPRRLPSPCLELHSQNAFSPKRSMKWIFLRWLEGWLAHMKR